MNSTIEEEWIKCRYDFIVDTLRSLTGIDPEEPRRIRSAVYMRYCVAKAMETYTNDAEIGRLMHKDRTTVLYYSNCMNDIIQHPEIDRNTYAIWQKLRNALNAADL